MTSRPRDKQAVAITACLHLEPTHILYRQAQSLVVSAEEMTKTNKDARFALGNVHHSTWVRWKRMAGLEVKRTKPAKWK